ncbi:thiamine pyrophosphate-binding protein [Paenibacillus oryzisoli]|uniref:thiamine pyrophosphate-binding protein n=1 Tax=Paenibacillus oryzisoli TaxID=1850517 RepID=UPI003D2C3A55
MSGFTVAEAVLEQLRLWGVKRIYGVTGDAIFGFMDTIAKQEQITFIQVKHESVAALMASAEAKLTGGLAVCIAQTGPGLANLMVGLGDAYMDKVKVLAITGQAPLSKIGTPYKQLINQQQLMQAISGYSQLVTHPDAAMEGLTEAMHQSLTNHTVSHLSIPSDVFQLNTTIIPKRPPGKTEIHPDTASLEQAVELMRSAARPMILLGGGFRHERELLARLAELWGCGIALSYGVIGIMQDDYPLLLNGLGEGGNPYLDELFMQADTVLVLESDWWPESSVPLAARVIRVASHPELLGITRPADVAIVGSRSIVISQFIDRLKGYNASPSWKQQIQINKETWLRQVERETSTNEVPLHPSRIIRAIEHAIDDDAVIALDEGDSTLWFLRNFRARLQQVLLSNHFRTMGFGLPAAMAAKLCWPDKQVVCITGDGGLGMVMADLLTAARYGLAICIIVFRNDSLQMEKDKMVEQGLRLKGTEITNPNFAEIAEACGWHARRITTPEQLEDALSQIRSISHPLLLEVTTARVPYPDFQIK